MALSYLTPRKGMERTQIIKSKRAHNGTTNREGVDLTKKNGTKEENCREEKTVGVGSGHGEHLCVTFRYTLC